MRLGPATSGLCDTKDGPLLDADTVAVPLYTWWLVFLVSFLQARYSKIIVLFDVLNMLGVCSGCFSCFSFDGLNVSQDICSSPAKNLRSFTLPGLFGFAILAGVYCIPCLMCNSARGA